MSTDWNTYAGFQADPPEGSGVAGPPPAAADLAAAENPVGITPEQCERHRLAYLRALLAEVRGEGKVSRRPRPKPRTMLAEADVTDALALPQNAGVRIERQTRRNVERIRREDVFARLLGAVGDRDESARRGAALAAVRRLETDLLERACRGDRADVRVRVDGTAWRGELATDRSIDAGDRVDRALAGVGVRDARLLSELLAPTLVVTDAVNGWRLAVQRLTGEKNEQAQAGAVRGAADNLRLAYEALDRRPRR